MSAHLVEILNKAKGAWKIVCNCGEVVEVRNIDEARLRARLHNFQVTDV